MIVNNSNNRIGAIDGKKNLIISFFLIFFLSFASFHYAFNFSLVLDDWMQLWAVLFHTPAMDHYLKWAPNSAVEFILLAKLLGFNYFYWQLIGFVLKIIASFSVSFMTLAIFRSKIIAFYSGIIYASFVGGLESFTRLSAQNHSLSIPTICLGISFWVTSYYRKSATTYILAVIFIVITLISYSGSTNAMFFILLLWELLTLLQNDFKIAYFLERSVLLLTTFLILNFLTSVRFLYNRAGIESNLTTVLNNPFSAAWSFISSIGNLLIGWAFYIEEALGLSKSNFMGLLAGYLLITLILTVFILFLKRKRDIYKNLIFFLLWILFFYFPSWMASGLMVNGNVIAGVTNRYFAIPSVGLVIIIAFFISTINNKFLRVLTLIVILSSNILMANRILKDELSYRSIEVQDKLYDQINRTVAKGKERESIFVFLGDNDLRLFALDWNGAFPFALKRKITDLDGFPVVTNSIDVINKLLCGETDTISISAGVGSPINVKGKKFLLENLYAWVTVNGDLQDVSEEIRGQVQKQLRCNN